MLFVFTEVDGNSYCFYNEEDLHRFVKMYGCEYYDSASVFPVEEVDYTITTLNIMTPEQAIADYKGE